MASVIDEQQCVLPFLEVLIDLSAHLVDRDLYLLIVGVLKDKHLLFLKLEFTKASFDHFKIILNLGQVGKILPAFKLTQLFIVVAPYHNSLLLLGPKECRARHAHEIILFYHLYRVFCFLI